MARKVSLQYQIKKFENPVLRPIKDKQYWIPWKRRSPSAFGYSQEQRITRPPEPKSWYCRLRGVLVPILVCAPYKLKKVGMFNRLNQLSRCFDPDCWCALKVYSNISKSVIITWEKPVNFKLFTEADAELQRQWFSKCNSINRWTFKS